MSDITERLRDASTSYVSVLAIEALDEIERLRDEIEVLRGERDIALRSFADEIERLREELAFYADDRNYRMNGPLDPNSGSFNGATRAKDALKVAIP